MEPERCAVCGSKLISKRELKIYGTCNLQEIIEIWCPSCRIVYKPKENKEE